jgi:adenylate cyclase
MARSLAAVLAADVVGYSALMGSDSEATLAALRRLRAEVFAPAVAARRGRVVKSLGDGWIVLFPSAADAVTCALQVQDRLADAPRAGEPAIRLRIGVHIGDVTEADEDVFGDGVNLAARLEGFAEPGAVAVSEAVRDALDGRLRPSFDPAGERRFKNIDRPVRVWTRAPRGGPAPAAAAPARAADPRLRLAVRPVAVTDERAEIRELAAALTGDLEIQLAAAHWLSTGVAAAPGEEAYALETRLRARGDRLRLEARLTGRDGAAVWSGKFDGDLADVFDWQDETGGEVADAALPRLADAERRRLLALPYEGLSAAECLLLAEMESFGVDEASMQEASRHVTRAMALDPGMIEPLAFALTAYISAASIGLAAFVEENRDAFPGWLARARAVRHASPWLDAAVANAEYQQDRDAPKLRAALQRSLRAAPFSGPVTSYCGWGYVWLGEPETALDILGAALRLSRRFGFWRVPTLGGLGLAAVQAGRDEDALRYAEEGLRLSATYPTLHRIRAAACAWLGRDDEAREAVAEALRLVPDDAISTGRARSGYADTPETRRWFEGLRRAGLPE